MTIKNLIGGIAIVAFVIFGGNWLYNWALSPLKQPKIVTSVTTNHSNPVLAPKPLPEQKLVPGGNESYVSMAQRGVPANFPDEQTRRLLWVIAGLVFIIGFVSLFNLDWYREFHLSTLNLAVQEYEEGEETLILAGEEEKAERWAEKAAEARRERDGYALKYGLRLPRRQLEV